MTIDQQIKYHTQELKKAQDSLNKVTNRLMFKDSTPKVFRAYKEFSDAVAEHREALNRLGGQLH